VSQNCIESIVGWLGFPCR